MGCAGFLCTRSMLALLNVFYIVSYSNLLVQLVVTAVAVCSLSALVLCELAGISVV